MLSSLFTLNRCRPIRLEGMVLRLGYNKKLTKANTKVAIENLIGALLVSLTLTLSQFSPTRKCGQPATKNKK